MAFDRARAREVLDLGDRDTAPFFAGRDREIRRFEMALRASTLKPQTVFRIYQGAPGCGKTSLLAQLRNRYGSKAVRFVRVEEKHLAGAAAVAERVREAAFEESVFGKAGAEAIRVVGEPLRLSGTGERTSGFIARMAAGRIKTAVLYMDEAHTLGAAERPGLLEMHRSGLGKPSVCLLAGLSHTAGNIENIPGLSRLSTNAVVDMGTMSEGECAESTRMMLDALGAAGNGGDKHRVAAAVAAMSRGWPRHLHCAQAALCRELLRADGVLREVNVDRVRAESDRNRHDYYLRRLRFPVLARHRPVALSVVAGIGEPAGIVGLETLCQKAFDDSGRPGPFDAGEFARTLVEKGVVSITLDDRCEVSIPSMAVWAASMAAGDPPSGRDRRNADPPDG